MPTGLFVTGTDTGVGKTLVSAALLYKYNQQGLATAAMKPVASGCRQTGEGLRNNDALLLQQAASVSIDYETVNPYAFEPPVAPHLAAGQCGKEIDLAVIQHHFDSIAGKAEVTIVEGVGGWYVPINDQQTMIDVARQMALPVILVVGMRLGCLNHALLTSRAIESDGLRLAGWVANSIEADMALPEDNIRTLQDTISSPCLGHIPYQPGNDAAAISEFIALP